MLSTQMAGRDETTTMEEPGKGQAGRKKRIHLRIGGPEILVGALAVAVVVGAAIRIRRSRSLREAKKRIQHSCRDDRSGGLRSVLQADEDHPRCHTMDVTKMVLSRMSEHDSVEHEIQTEKIEENEASDAVHGEWMAKEISESNVEEEDYDSANEDMEEEDNDDAEDEESEKEEEEEEEDEDARDEVAGYEADKKDGIDENDDEEDEGECVVDKCEEGSQGTEYYYSTTESNAEVVWPVEMKEWPQEIKEIKISYQEGRIPKTESYNFLNEMERRIPVKIKIRIWIWTTLMLLLLLLLSLTNQKSYVSLYY